MPQLFRCGTGPCCMAEVRACCIGGKHIHETIHKSAAAATAAAAAPIPSLAPVSAPRADLAGTASDSLSAFCRLHRCAARRVAAITNTTFLGLLFPRRFADQEILVCRRSRSCRRPVRGRLPYRTTISTASFLTYCLSSIRARSSACGRLPLTRHRRRTSMAEGCDRRLQVRQSR